MRSHWFRAVLVVAGLGCAAACCPAAEVLPYPWTPIDITGVQLALWAGHTDAIQQEEFTASPQTPIVTPAVYGSPVGTVRTAQEGHVFTALSDAYRPTLLQYATTGDRQSAFRFGYGGSQPSSLILQNSTGCFRNIWTTQCYQVAFFIRMTGGDGGSTQTILDNISDANTSPGFNIQRDSDNKVYLETSKGGSWLSTPGTTKTLMVADGWQPVIFTSLGQGTGLGTISIGGSVSGGVFVPSNVVTFNNPNAGAAIGTNATQNLTIGSTAGNAKHGQFDLDNLVIVNGQMSPSDLLNWYNFNPARTTASVLRVRSNLPKLVPTDINFCWAWWDFTQPTDPANDQPLIYTSSAKSTAVTTTDNTGAQNSGYVENRLGAHLLRFLYQPAALHNGYPYAPTWLTGQQNGRPAAFFNGSWNSSTNYSQPYALALNQPTPPTDKTWYCVFQNLSGNSVGTTGGNAAGQVGSHLFNNSSATSQYSAIGGLEHTSPIAFIEHLGNSATNAPAQATFSSLNFSAGNSVTDGTYVPFGTILSAPTYYCAAKGMYVYYVTSGTWYLSSVNGATGGSLPSAYWQTSVSNNLILQNFAKQGTASADAGTPTATPAAGPTAVNIYHGQQRYLAGTGSQTRLGVNGYWGQWTTNTSPTGSMWWDNFGYDGHQNNGTLNANPSATQHFELNGLMYEFAMFDYSLPDHVFYGLLRTAQARFDLPNVYIGN